MLKFNVTHGYDGELVLNLKAPNGNRLNLVNQEGGSGNNFTNTIISSATVTPINGNPPYTGTYSADAANNVGATGQVSNVSAFSSLYGTPNGNWSFSARDLVGCRAFFFGFCYDGPYTGTINNWSITINYTDAKYSSCCYMEPGNQFIYRSGCNHCLYRTKPFYCIC